MVDSEARAAILDDGLFEKQKALAVGIVATLNNAADNNVFVVGGQRVVVGGRGEDVAAGRSGLAGEEGEGRVGLAVRDPGGTVREGQARRGLVGDDREGGRGDGQEGEGLGYHLVEMDGDNIVKRCYGIVRLWDLITKAMGCGARQQNCVRLK